MNICGKGNFPECQFFTTGGCVSPSNCIYKIKQDFNTRATSNAMEISRTAENSELRHRAEIAERALLNMTKKYILAERKIATTKDGWFSFGEAQIALLADEAIKQAEKELAEERKDD